MAFGGSLIVRTLKQLMQLDGRKALVTGGAGHIGLAIGEVLLELGATVAILDTDQEACDQRVADLVARYGKDRIVPVYCDLQEEEATRVAVNEVITRLGGLDILVHSAAYVGTTDIPGWAVDFDAQEVAAWDAALRVNLTSAFIMTQEAKRALGASGRGAVVFLSSIYGLVGPDLRLYEETAMGHPAAYGASKAGVLQFARYLATTLAPSVRVNAITPGGVWRDQPQEFQKRYTDRTPLGRMATEEDLKGAVAYLASDLSLYVTGHNLVVDGGWTAW
jgi:NAD(P)-dependent dehydrogenase (short-subunit alcohol dehydrogenase family)